MADITENSLREIITERLKAVHVEVTDMSGKIFRPSQRTLSQYSHIPGGCGQAFTTLIVSHQFRGLTSLKRHRLVNAALKEEIAVIHAWTARCQTPEEWEKDTAAAPPTDGTVAGKVEGTSA